TTAAAAANPLAEPHEPHWVSRAAFPLMVGMLVLNLGAIFAALYYNNYWLAVPLSLIASHLMHGNLIGFHEASHGMLRKSRFLNDLDGVFIGSLSFMSFTLYRASHQTHHAHLGCERDEELWPFVDTKSPRWFRRLMAFTELFFGLFHTPVLFLRTFLKKNSPIRSKKVRKRVWMELIGIIVFWAVILTVVAKLDAWKYWLWMYFVPGFIAGNLQSWRKYIEHVGLTGSTIRSATRSIIADTWTGKLVSFTLLHEPFHGVHHQRAGLPHAELPVYQKDLYPTHEEELAPFRSYSHAMVHLIQNLSDPRVGAQWRSAGRAKRQA
ncbi:MAG TPA: fatty acid desaturase, partial [Candidatus Saccharimonadia bacterium]|nr:fatty acid desaturase [Candidatus Saccharimonadia bacterium]